MESEATKQPLLDIQVVPLGKATSSLVSISLRKRRSEEDELLSWPYMIYGVSWIWGQLQVVYRPISSEIQPDLGPQLRSLLVDTETSVLTKLRDDLRHTQVRQS